MSVIGRSACWPPDMYSRSRSFLDLGQKVIYISKLKLVFFRNHLTFFDQILYVSFQVKGNENMLMYNGGHMTRWLPCPYMVKSLKNLLWNQWTDFHELWHRGPLPFVFCLHYDPGMTMTYFTARSNFVT